MVIAVTPAACVLKNYVRCRRSTCQPRPNGKPFRRICRPGPPHGQRRPSCQVFGQEHPYLRELSGELDLKIHHFCGGGNAPTSGDSARMRSTEPRAVKR